MRKSVVLLLVIVLASVFANIGCSTKTKDDSNNVVRSSVTEVVDYGNNVFYFAGGASNFGNSLSHFLQENPNLEVSAMTAGVHFGDGIAKGYFVTFRQKLPVSKE